MLCSACVKCWLLSGRACGHGVASAWAFRHLAPCQYEHILACSWRCVHVCIQVEFLSRVVTFDSTPSQSMARLDFQQHCRGSAASCGDVQSVVTLTQPRDSRNLTSDAAYITAQCPPSASAESAWNEQRGAMCWNYSTHSTWYGRCIHALTREPVA